MRVQQAYEEGIAARVRNVDRHSIESVRCPMPPTKYPLPWRKQSMTIRPIPFTVIAGNGKTVCDVYREEAADYIVAAVNRMAEMVPEVDLERG